MLLLQEKQSVGGGMMKVEVPLRTPTGSEAFKRLGKQVENFCHNFSAQTTWRFSYLPTAQSGSSGVQLPPKFNSLAGKFVQLAQV